MPGSEAAVARIPQEEPGLLTAILLIPRCKGRRRVDAENTNAPTYSATFS